MAESLELASTGRSKCVVCKEPIAKDAWRMKVTMQSNSYDGESASMHHAICAAMRRPTPFLRTLAAAKRSKKLKFPPALAGPLNAIATTTKARKLVDVVWRHATEPRCILAFAGSHHVLFTHARGKDVVTEGTLDQVVNSVPDDDLEDVTDTVLASGKTLGAAKPPAKSATVVGALRQRFSIKQGGKKVESELVLDPAKRRVTIDATGSPHHETFATAELAAKYFRYTLVIHGAKYVSGDRVTLDANEDFKDVKDKTSDYRYLENPKTKQFWDIDRDYTIVTVCEGAIGTGGTRREEELDWDGDAKRRYKELMAEKLAAGYAEPRGAAQKRATGKKR